VVRRFDDTCGKLGEKHGVMCQMLRIIIIIRNLYSAIMPLGGYRGARRVHKSKSVHEYVS